MYLYTKFDEYYFSNQHRFAYLILFGVVAEVEEKKLIEKNLPTYRNGKKHWKSAVKKKVS